MALHFHLAGINNQNFLMRDEETGTFWQQITGLGVSGPLAGRRLTLVSADELSFAVWKSENPHGTVLNDVSQFSGDYAKPDWDVRMARVPTVINYEQGDLKPRSLMLGIHAFGASRAVPFDSIVREKLIIDHVGDEPVLIVLGRDEQSVRVFRRRLTGVDEPPQFYRLGAESGPAAPPIVASDALLMDAPTGSRWNFQGCAVSGKLKGVCLEQVNAIKDYWFDWRHYNADTTVYGIKHRIQ